MTSLRLLRLLAEGELEIARGKGYDLRTVLAEADALLDGDRFTERPRRGRTRRRQEAR
jgi:hypothetical protein